MTPDASVELAPLVLVMGVAGVLYGALLATGQRDMKRFIAYVSIAHFGFIALGIFAFSTQSEVGAVSYMLNHSISTGMLILVIGMVIARGGSSLIADYGGLAKITPGAGRRVPGRRSRLAVAARHELLHLASSWCWSGRTADEPVYTILATVGMILAALYVLWLYQRVFHGPVRGNALVGVGGRPRHRDRAGGRRPQGDPRPERPGEAGARTAAGPGHRHRLLPEAGARRDHADGRRDTVVGRYLGRRQLSCPHCLRSLLLAQDRRQGDAGADQLPGDPAGADHPRRGVRRGAGRGVPAQAPALVGAGVPDAAGAGRRRRRAGVLPDRRAGRR